MNFWTKISLIISSILLLLFLTTQSLVILDIIEYVDTVGYIGVSLFISSIPFISVFVWQTIKRNKETKKEIEYQRKLKNVIISQSRNSFFYEGRVNDGARSLTREVTNTIETERCSIWLYNKNKSSIICSQLYIKSEDHWHSGAELYKKDYEDYFIHLEIDPIIIANHAETHSATSCFKERYLTPLGIKSMLDVPITYKGETIGVICIESLTQRDWTEGEVNFAQMLSTLYSFAYSIKEGNNQQKQIEDIENFIEEAALVSKTDNKGRIIYANKKFTEVSGWTLEELIGKDHSIVNSGLHPKSMWDDMYNETINKKKVWNKVVTNKSKSGKLYHVDTYIKAEFNPETNKLIGFTSIRQDVTKIIESLNEIDKKNTYLEHAAKILRHDMHSGINTYIPRGVSSLERRLTEENIKNLKIESPLKMIKEGLKHTQKVYKGVYEFTNLVKKDVVLTKSNFNVKEILEDYLSSTSYKSQVFLDNNLPNIIVNESLFCTSIDNLIRNGLKYNDSDTKWVKIYLEDDSICVEDNGRGMTEKEFEELSKPYVRKRDQMESGTGLGLNICIAILQEHGFKITCCEKDGGTKLKIKVYD